MALPLNSQRKVSSCHEMPSKWRARAPFPVIDFHFAMKKKKKRLYYPGMLLQPEAGLLGSPAVAT